MGRLLGVLIGIITLITVYLFTGRIGWFPEQVSEYAPAIDQQFMRTLVVVGIAFVLAQITLGYYVWRYRDRGRGQVIYTHGSTKLEIGLLIFTTTVFVTLAVMGQKVWAQLHLQEVSADALQVEVTAQQFAWNFRYPGPDGRFGRTESRLIDDQTNPVGLDPKDPASADDIVTVNRLAIPVGREVRLTQRSKDVTHSFFAPVLRIKQDTVPGMAIPLHFKAMKIGEYEIACAELCGLEHYKMKGYLMVMPNEAFDAWLKERATR
jgi:cytochrome c oxidase subunit 2